MELSEEESIYNLLKFAKNKDGSGIRNNQRWKPKINPDCIVLPKYLDKKLMMILSLICHIILNILSIFKCSAMNLYLLQFLML